MGTATRDNDNLDLDDRNHVPDLGCSRRRNERCDLEKIGVVGKLGDSDTKCREVSLRFQRMGERQ